MGAIMQGLAIILLLTLGSTMSEPDANKIAEVIAAEAANQGYDGMYAVACVMRNRGWDLSGFSGAKRQNLTAFYKAQPVQVQKDALRIAYRLIDGAPDTTLGATHFENVNQFGLPYWADGMQQAVVIGAHTFFREAEVVQ